MQDAIKVNSPAVNCSDSCLGRNANIVAVVGPKIPFLRHAARSDKVVVALERIRINTA